MNPGSIGWRWLAALVAVVAALALPALRATAPLVAPVEWTAAQLGVEAVHAAQPAARQNHNLRSLLRQVRDLRRELGSGATGAANAGQLNAALTFAGLIPVLTLLAGLCAVVALGFELARRRRWAGIAAGIGLGASLYGIVASWWLTHAVHAAAAAMLARTQARLGGLLGNLNLGSLQSSLVKPLGLQPQAGLFVLALAFAAMLVWPAARSTGN